MRTAVRIQHHPSRARLLPRLLAELEDFDDVQVVADPDPDGKRETWPVHSACVRSLSAAAETLVVLQDDALPQPGFSTRLSTVVERWPEQILLGFVPGFPRERRLAQQTLAAGGDHFRFQVQSYLPLVCVVYPAAVANGLLVWADAQPRASMRADDSLVAEYARRRRLRPIALAPCLVDHDATVATLGRQQRRDGPHRRAALL